MNEEYPNCVHNVKACFCKECFQEIHQAFLEVKLDQARKSADAILKVTSNAQYDIHSPEFLRET